MSCVYVILVTLKYRYYLCIDFEVALSKPYQVHCFVWHLIWNTKNHITKIFKRSTEI